MTTVIQWQSWEEKQVNTTKNKTGLAFLDCRSTSEKQRHFLRMKKKEKKRQNNRRVCQPGRCRSLLTPSHWLDCVFQVPIFCFQNISDACFFLRYFRYFTWTIQSHTFSFIVVLLPTSWLSSAWLEIRLRMCDDRVGKRNRRRLNDSILYELLNL